MSNVVELAKDYADLCEHDGRGCKCAARWEGDCGCDDAEWASRHKAATIIRDLLAIVERLPVDGEGNPIAPGATMFSIHDADLCGVSECVIDTVDCRKWVTIPGGLRVRASLLYPTRAAAEEARKANG